MIVCRPGEARKARACDPGERAGRSGRRAPDNACQRLRRRAMMPPPAVRTPMTCARCQAEIPAGARFCRRLRRAARRRLSAVRHTDLRRPALLHRVRRRRRAAPCPPPRPASPAASPTEDGERRHATVMFSDLSGYTALNESFDPEEVEALMARVKADASAVIERHGGTVNQFVGDEIMALFGIPVARRDDARRAVAAALELHAVVDAYLATLEPASRAAWRCTPASPPGWSWRGAATPAPATSRSPATPSTRPPGCAAPPRRARSSSARRLGSRCPTPSTPNRPRRWRSKARTRRSSPIASSARARHRPATRRHWSGATRSCATSAPSPRPACSAGAAAS